VYWQKLRPDKKGANAAGVERNRRRALRDAGPFEIQRQQSSQQIII
jgi:hypothetical protein